MRVPVAGKGLTVATIRKLAVDPAFQRRVAAALPQPPSDRGFSRVETGLPAIGTLTGMLISVVPDFADAFVYVDATEKDAPAVEFRYRLGDGEWTVVRDTAYPFELSVHVPDPSQAVEVRVEATDPGHGPHGAAPRSGAMNEGPADARNRRTQGPYACTGDRRWTGVCRAGRVVRYDARGSG